jgi:hypothetical protein
METGVPYLRYIQSCIDPNKIMNIPVKTADWVAMKHSEIPLSTQRVVTVMFGGQYNIWKIDKYLH